MSRRFECFFGFPDLYLIVFEALYTNISYNHLSSSSYPAKRASSSKLEQQYTLKIMDKVYPSQKDGEYLSVDIELIQLKMPSMEVD